MNLNLLDKVQRKLFETFKSSYLRADREVICGEEVVNNPKSYYPTGHLDRIKAVDPVTTMSAELDRITNANLVHAECSVVHLKNVGIYNGFLCNNKYMLRFPCKVMWNVQLGFSRVPMIPSCLLSQKYFGHSVHDDLSGAYLAEGMNVQFVLPYKLNYAHILQYIDAIQCSIELFHQRFYKELCISIDYSQNSHKASRYEQIRVDIRKKYNDPERKIVAGVYIKRGKTGVSRRLLNEDCLIEFLKLMNWVVIEPEAMTVAQIMCQLIDCENMMAVEGSAVSHALMSIRRGGNLIVLQPPRRFGSVLKGIMNAIGVKFGFYVCAEGREPDSFYIDDFSSLQKLIFEMQG